MTAQEIIEKIRAEIERQKADWIETMKKHGEDGYIPSFIESLDRILSTIQEQPVKIDIRKELASIEFMGVNDARDSETIARHFYELGCRRTAEKYDEIEYKRQRSDVCEGLEEEIEMYFEDWDSNPNGAFFDKEGYKIGIIALKNIARHFAQWGAEHRGSSEIPNDLEEAARHSEILTYPMPEDGDIEKVFKVQEARIFHEIGFITGAKWQEEQDLKYISEIHRNGYNLCKEQMMKEAVEASVGRNFTGVQEIRFTVYPDKYEDGDKVKLIIVKED